MIIYIIYIMIYAGLNSFPNPINNVPQRRVIYRIVLENAEGGNISLPAPVGDAFSKTSRPWNK